MHTIKAAYTTDELFDIFKMIFFTNTKLVDLPRYDDSFEKSGMTQEECNNIVKDIQELFDIKSPMTPAWNWPCLYADILMQLDYEGRVTCPQKQNPIEPKTIQKYTRHQIYDTLLRKLGNVMQRKLYTDQILGGMMYYAGLDKSGKQFNDLTKQFRDIQDTFKIKIYASYTLNDVASLIEWSLARYGKFDPRNETKNKFLPQNNKQK